MAECHRKPHAIMISIPYQGHINPFVNLALKIASKGFSITFVHFESVHHRVSKAHHLHCNKTQVDIFSEARESGLDIRYTTISDGLPVEFDRYSNFEEYWGRILRDFPARVDEFVGKIIQSDPYVDYFFVADTFFPYPATIAEKYNLVNVSLWTQPALVFTLAYHLDLLRENGHFPCKDNIHEEVNYIPGVKPISTRDLVSVMKESEQGYHTMLTSLFMASDQAKKADFILHNTVHELEADTLSALNKYQPNYAIGPINFFKNLPTYTVSKSLWSESDCSEWLESKPPDSVLYVSFGSFVHTSRQVIEEIAYGLLLSQVNFIWAIREGILSSGDTNIMPNGYEDEVEDKGLIIPWCNQIRVLSNPAVGGFLTHNGWNSTIESMWCAVPMICYPFSYDQPTNRKLVVDDWKCGISLCDGTSVDRKEVAEKIKSFMSGAATKSFRQEADKVKTILHHALEVDGSSERNFDQFIKDLKDKIHSTTTSIK
ncbi:UDP-glycosyltransferase 86A1-like [Sesamum indicum]|uniref:UDP-glycosyltransferase 86A1-like n=1 Tax=Sesamum indicum TaxID=4182 RepID=A0A6I9U5X4_SESIN|nr:UDP-glycosyltransferase 86A1-like [Sesamum indicum]